jgi:hypothetical protein
VQVIPVLHPAVQHVPLIQDQQPQQQQQQQQARGENGKDRGPPRRW